MEQLKKIKDNYILVVFLFGLIFSGFMFAHNTLNKYDELLNKLNTTQQMSLKSVIWNESIPKVERAAACDVYLGAGYNSMTKKECQDILENGVN